MSCVLCIKSKALTKDYIQLFPLTFCRLHRPYGSCMPSCRLQRLDKPLLELTSTYIGVLSAETAETVVDAEV